MKAVILGAGRGTRLGGATKDTPKPLIKVLGKPIAEYSLMALPEKIREVIFVVGHMGDKIEATMGHERYGKKLSYVSQKELNGTMSALATARDLLGEELFLVLNGDDIYRREDIEKLIGSRPAMGVYRGHTERKSITIEADSNSIITGYRLPSDEERKREVVTATGAYVLDSRIFSHPFEDIPGGEKGLPQTVLSFAREYPVKAVYMDFWLPINTAEELSRAQEGITRL